MEELFLTLKTTNMKCELIFYYTCTAVLFYKFSRDVNILTNILYTSAISRTCCMVFT